MQPVSFKRHRFPPDVIRLAVWLYFLCYAPRLDAALVVERELPAEKEVLRRDGSPTSGRQHNEAGHVGE